MNIFVNTTIDGATAVLPEEDSAEVTLMLTILEILSKYLWMVFVIVGLPGNLLSIAIALQKDNRKVSTCVYMTALAIADTLKCVDALWGYPVVFSSQPAQKEVQGIWYLGYTGSILSGFFLMEMSIDRLIAVRFPMQAKLKCTTSRAVKAIVATTCAVCIINIHVFWWFKFTLLESTGAQGLKIDIPEARWLEPVILTYHTVCGTFIPFLVIVACNILIIVTLREASNRRKEMGIAEKSQKTQGKETKHLTRMLIIVCVAYVVLSVPYRLYDLILEAPFFKSLYDWKKKYWSVRYVMQYFTLMHFWEWNYAINFYLYCIGGGKKYRQDVRKIFKAIFFCK